MRTPLPRLRSRAGFSLVEMLVAMGLTLVVFAITLPFVRAQGSAVGASAGRLDADQLARYAVSAIDRDLRRASADSGQPLLVLAGPRAISFTSNLVAADTTDLDATDVDDFQSTAYTASWRVAAARTLPLTNRTYPLADQRDETGAVSRRETISYFLRSDTVASRPDQYVLWRRVNGNDSVQVVRGLVLPADSAFFTYSVPQGDTLAAIATNRLPLYWDSVAVDSIRSVRILATGRFVDPKTLVETVRTVRWTTMVPNAGRSRVANCGAAPAAISGSIQVTTGGEQNYRHRLSWGRSGDDGQGEDDVRTYVIAWRTASPVGRWISLASVTANAGGNYKWLNEQPLISTGVQYGIRAIDCAGQGSAYLVSSTVAAP